MYGRRLILEWATVDEDVDQLRKRTADHFHSDSGAKKSKKSVFDASTMAARAGNGNRSEEEGEE